MKLRALPALKHFDHIGKVNSCGFRKAPSLGTGKEICVRDQVVDHFHGVSGAGWSEVDQFTGAGLQNRARRFQDFGIAPDHQCHGALVGTFRPAAGHAGIHVRHPGRCRAALRDVWYKPGRMW